MTTDVQTSSILAEFQAERLHQGTTDGYVRLDLSHDEGELAMAAAAFAVQSTGEGSGADILWPWSSLMPAYAPRRHSLIVAGALIMAEIERIDHASGGLSAAAVAEIRKRVLGDQAILNDQPRPGLIARLCKGLPRIRIIWDYRGHNNSKSIFEHGPNWVQITLPTSRQKRRMAIIVWWAVL